MPRHDDPGFREHAVNQHVECRDHFIRATMALRTYMDAGNLPAARYELLRANAAVGQGIVWAGVLDWTISGWLDRMREIEETAAKLDIIP